VRGLAAHLPLPARVALEHSYRVGFTSALSSILVIAALIALAGAVCAFVLVRGRDFVASGAGEGAPESAGAEAVPA